MTMTIEMPEAMEKRVRERCAREGRSVGEGVVAAVVAWLEGEPEAPEWHARVLEERKRRVLSGEEEVFPWGEVAERLEREFR